MEIPARCRDENGYLVRQHLMKDIPYGRRTAAKVGCGFIAVYNAARYFGLPVSEGEVWEYFHRHVYLGGVVGTSIFHICRGLRRFGMKVTAVRYRDLKGARAGILWYHTGRSRHYVLAYRREDGRYAFPNSSAAEPMAFSAFCDQYVKRLPLLRLPIMFTVTAERRDNPAAARKH